MKIEQPLNLVRTYNSTIVGHYNEIIHMNGGLSFEVDFITLYTYIYGHNPTYFYSGVEKKDDKSVMFIDSSVEYMPMSDKYSRLSKNYSIVDTARKMGCIAYPVPLVAIYLTEIGMLTMRSYNAKIGNSDVYRISELNIYTNDKANVEQLEKFVKENLVMVENNSLEKASYVWVREGYSSSLSGQRLEFNKMEVDVSKNYNDDIPYDTIVKLLKSKTKELILFNGKPGTGKTSFIKYLISELDEKNFLYIDSNLLKNVSSSSFISFLLDHRNSVIVLEDCEKILAKREEGNPFMGTLLNLTDGIIGETVNCKFICSFNCPESKIDEALLRKGRLSLKYTFAPLTLEKTKALIPNATRGMTLADIYHANEVNVINKQEIKKIGF